MDTAILTQLEKTFEPELLTEILKCQTFIIKAGTKSSQFDTQEKMRMGIIPIVLSGYTTVFQKDNYGNDVKLYDVKEGESCILSINSVLSTTNALMETIAPVDCEFAIVQKEQSTEWFEKYTSWRKFVINLYSKRLNELVKKHNTVSEQNVKIEGQHKKIKDSINYAKRIQDAVFPTLHFIDEATSESFILFKPRDVVSGDFYWISKEGTKVIIAAADATGHGVPGAFMSMLGIAFLNEIKENISGDKLSPNNILEELRNRIKNSLKQTGKNDEAKDGMDIAMFMIDTETKMLDFAGAHNPLYKISVEGVLTELKSDRQPIGIHLKEKPFTNHSILLNEGDCLYIFSDGYADQFGGEKGGKFKTKNLKHLLLSIHKKPMAEQNEILEKTFNDWKGDIDQVDDVLLMGFRI